MIKTSFRDSLFGWSSCCLLFCLRVFNRWPTSGFAQSNSARALFADNKAGILQIRIIDITSGSKSAIGSGFVVNDSGLIATNYHVVQMAASKPEQYRIEYLSADGAAGSLNLVDVDVINDLALVQEPGDGAASNRRCCLWQQPSRL